MKRALLLLSAGLMLSAASCDNECIGSGPECVDAPPLEFGPVDPSTDWCDVRDEVLPSCVACHEFRDPRLVGDDDAIYAELLKNSSASNAYVVEGSPEQSYLWRKVEGTHLESDISGNGGKMPTGSFEGVFDEREDLRLRQLVRDWIANGAGTECRDQVADAGPATADAGAPAADAGLPAADAGPSVCGDSNVTGDEECDDGNNVDGDGCEADCTNTPPDAACGVVSKITSTCLGCHASNGSGTFTLGRNLEAWATATVNVPSSRGRGNQVPYITPGNKEQSFLFLKVAGRQGGTGGDRMPRDGPPYWSDDEVGALGQWIDDGLPTPQFCD